MSRYFALIDGKAGAYGVVVPDLPGCTSGGATTDEALRNAVSAVRLWAEDALADGERLPQPRSAEQMRADPEVAEAISDGAALAIVPFCSTKAAPPRPLCQSTQACSLPSTTLRRSMASPVRPSSPAQRAKRSRATTP